MKAKHLRGKVRYIEVATAIGIPQRVRATVYGPLALHRSIRQGGTVRGHYSVTHLATGYAVDTFLPLPRAKRLLRAALASAINWNFDSPSKMSKRTRAIGTRLMRQVAREFPTAREVVLA